MTVSQAISRVDRLRSNAFSLEDKLLWLGKLEGILRRNILDTHEPGLTYTPIGADTPADTPLLAPEPFDEMYLRWLEAMIDLYNGETDRFNADIALFNTEYAAFESWYNRSYAPGSGGGWRL